MVLPKDLDTRKQALNLKKSFIIQAPAGSGKTEILIQRYLAALADSQKLPEEVLAITFTKKAAAEMKHRIIEALRLAELEKTPGSEHEKTTFNLAKLVLAKDKSLSWDLINKQHKICVMTIDAMCSKINAQSQNFNAQPTCTPKQLYINTTRDFIQDLLQDGNQDFKECLSYFDNQVQWIENLLCESLASRDQWLPLIFMTDSPKAAATKYIEFIWQEILLDCNDILNSKIIRNCYNNVYKHDDNQKHQLKNIANLLLTKTGDTRATFTKKQGIPSNTPKHEKQLIKEELTDIANKNSSILKKIKAAPLLDNEELYEIVPKLISLLQKLAAYLKLHMRDQLTTDYIEQAQLCLYNLSYSIDWPDIEGIPRPGTIRHILLDEFQDTSQQQLKLITGIIQHFEPSVRNSLFIVGDPMQSIYRFRQADVSLFYRIQKQGIDNISLTNLQLTTNFRCNKQLIDFFNHLFPKIFPRDIDLDIGAVPYEKAESVNDKKATIKMLAFEDEISQFNEIANICKKNQDKSIGILVRSRAIANAMLPFLAGFNVNEHGLKSYYDQPEVKDLLAVMNFALNAYDNANVSALLRSRLIGISLQELYDICQETKANNLLDCFQEMLKLEEKSDFCIKYLTQLQILIDHANYQAVSIYEQTLKIWRALSPLSEADLLTSEISWQFFKLLRIAEKSNPNQIPESIEELLKSSAINADHAKINIMTIHHAKGLEFDLVILPCLEKTTAARSSKIVWWDQKDHGFLWLPNHPNQNQISSAHNYIYDLNSKKEYQEQIRLLYVAMTRAKSSLYCLATASNDCPPPKRSFAGAIWGIFEQISGQTCILDKQDFLEYFENKVDYHNKFVSEDLPLREVASYEQIFGIACHFWLYTYLSGASAVKKQTIFYLQEKLVPQELLQKVIQELDKRHEDIIEYEFIKHLKKQKKIWLEHSLFYKNQQLVIDVFFFDGYDWWIVDFKTNINPDAGTLLSWREQTKKYQEALTNKINEKFKTLIYNPISNELWAENKESYEKSKSYTSTSR